MAEPAARHQEAEGEFARVSRKPWGVAVSTFAVALGVALGLLGGHRQFNVDHDFVYGSARACGLGESCALVGPWNTIGVHLGPGFVYFLAPFLGISPDPWVPFVALLVLSSLAAAALAWVSTERFGVLAGIATGLFAATNHAGLRILATGLSSALGPLVVACIAVLALRWTEAPRRRTLIAIYVLVGIGMHCHSLVALLFLVPLGLRILSGRGSIVGPTIVGGCAVVVLHVPWLVHYGRVGFPDLSTLGVSPSGKRVPDLLILGALVVSAIGAWRRRRDAAGRLIGAGLGPLSLVVALAIALGAWQPYYSLIGLPFLALGLGHALSAHAPPVRSLQWAAGLCIAGALASTAVHVATGPPGAPLLGLDAQLEIVKHLADHGWAGRRLSSTVHGSAWDLDETAPVYLEAWKLTSTSAATPAQRSAVPPRGPLHALVVDHCDAKPDGFARATYRLSHARSPAIVAIYESRLDPIQAIAGARGKRCTSRWPGPPSHPQILGHLLRAAGAGRMPEVPTSVWPKRFSDPMLSDLEAHRAALFCEGREPDELVLRTRYRPGSDERSLVVRAGVGTHVSAVIGAHRYAPPHRTPHDGYDHTQRWTFPLDAEHDSESRTVQITLRPPPTNPTLRTYLVDVYEAPSQVADSCK